MPLSRFTQPLIFWGVCLLIITLPVERTATAFKSAAFVMIFGGWILRCFFERRVIFQKTPLDSFVAGYFMIIAASIFCSFDPLTSFSLFRKELFIPVAIYYAIVSNFDLQTLRKMIRIMLIGSAFICLYALTAMWGKFDPEAFMDTRLFGSFRHPNRLAQYLLIMAALHTAIFILSPSFKKRIALTCSFLLLPLCLFFTYSRAGWVAFFVTEFIYLFALAKNTKYLAAGLLVIFLIAALMTPGVLHRLQSDPLGGERPQIYQSVMIAFKDNPWLGVGFGDKVYLKAYADKYKLPGVTEDHSGAHNIFLQPLVETGISGMLAFALLHLKFAISIISGIRQIRRTKKIAGNTNYWLMFFSLSALAGVFTIGQLHSMYRDAGVFFIWMTMAIGMLVLLHEKNTLILTQKPKMRIAQLKSSNIFYSN